MNLINETSSPLTQEIPEAWTSPPQDAGATSATAIEERSGQVKQELATLCEQARNEYFEDGMESEFSRNLIGIIQKVGAGVVEELTFLILSDQINPEVASEALRWIGYIEHPSSYIPRRWLLERSLLCSSARIRDGALLGLSFLDDAHAVSYLKRAIEREGIEELRGDMKQVLEQLENSH